MNRQNAVCDGCGQIVCGIKDSKRRLYRDKPVFYVSRESDSDLMKSVFVFNEIIKK